MRAALLIPALSTSTSNRSPTIERTCSASSAAPFGVPRSAEIAFARFPFVWIWETRDSASCGRTAVVNQYMCTRLSTAPTQWLVQSHGKPRSPVQFCCAEPLLPPLLQELLSPLVRALAAL